MKVFLRDLNEYIFLSFSLLSIVILGAFGVSLMAVYEARIYIAVLLVGYWLLK